MGSGNFIKPQPFNFEGYNIVLGYSFSSMHGLRTTDEAFFLSKSQTLGLGLKVFGVF